jgi:hypothetical protein
VRLRNKQPRRLVFSRRAIRLVPFGRAGRVLPRDTDRGPRDWDDGHLLLRSLRRGVGQDLLHRMRREMDNDPALIRGIEVPISRDSIRGFRATIASAKANRSASPPFPGSTFATTQLRADEAKGRRYVHFP